MYILIYRIIPKIHKLYVCNEQNKIVQRTNCNITKYVNIFKYKFATLCYLHCQFLKNLSLEYYMTNLNIL